MNKIFFPLTMEMRGQGVADLQDGMRLLLERGILQLSDADRQTLEARLNDERAESIYLQATRTLVRLLQGQRQLQPSGAVDEPTARELNAVLGGLGAFSPATDQHRLVGGQVRNPDGSPFAGALRRAFDRDLRSEELLSEVATDGAGRYEISYTAEQFRRSEKRISTEDRSGKQALRDSLDLKPRKEGAAHA